MKRAAIFRVLSILFCVLAQPSYSQSRNEHVLPPLGHTYFCMRYPRDCDKTDGRNISSVPLALRWYQLNLINESVNAAIAPKRGRPEPVNTHWSIAPTEGDCNDYAVTKRHMLLEAGWPAASLLLAEVTLVATGEHHLILIVKGTKADWVLDNLQPSVVRLEETRNNYILDRVESDRNPKFWTKLLAS